MKYEVDWKGQKYSMEWSDSRDFESLKNVVQVYGFVFDNYKKLCIVDCKKGYWCLPGGHPEKVDKSFEDTLRREVNEEADLDIKNIRRVGYFKITPISKSCKIKEIHYLLRFVAEVAKVKRQTIDPAEGAIPKRKFIDTKDFLKFVDWKDNGAFQLKKAMEAIYGKSTV